MLASALLQGATPHVTLATVGNRHDHASPRSAIADGLIADTGDMAEARRIFGERTQQAGEELRAAASGRQLSIQAA